MNAAMLGPDAIGYDPARVQVLGRRTSDSIRALDAIVSSDPAAAAAMRVVRLIRHNLSDLWMPLIRAQGGGGTGSARVSPWDTSIQSCLSLERD